MVDKLDQEFEWLLYTESKNLQTIRQIENLIQTGKIDEANKLIEELYTKSRKQAFLTEQLASEVKTVKKENFDIRKHLEAYVENARNRLDQALSYSKKKDKPVA